VWRLTALRISEAAPILIFQQSLIQATRYQEHVAQLGFKKLGRFRRFAEFPVNIVQARHAVHTSRPIPYPSYPHHTEILRDDSILIGELSARTTQLKSHPRLLMPLAPVPGFQENADTDKSLEAIVDVAEKVKIWL